MLIQCRPSAGVGDTLVAWWAVAAVQALGLPVQFRGHSAVEPLFLPPDLRQPTGEPDVDVFDWPDNRFDVWRGQAWLDKIGIAGAQIGARPQLLPGIQPEAAAAGKTLLFPMAATSARRWPITHWAELERLLRLRGFDVAVCLPDCTGTRHEAATVAFRNPVFLADWAELARWMLAARLVVCNDSGPLHLAGILNLRTVAIFAQVAPHVLIGPGYNATAVTPDWPGTCAACGFGRAPGSQFQPRKCRGTCAELWSISPRRVAAAAAQAAD